MYFLKSTQKYKGNANIKTLNDIVKILLEKGSNYDAIIFSGGDGTVNDVVNAVMKLDKQPILGYLPSGTCNDFARSLKKRKKLSHTKQ